MLCEPCVEHGIEVKTKRATAFEIVRGVGEFCNVPVDKILGKTRYQNIVEARMLVAYLMRNDRNLKYSLTLIAKLLNKRDHSTIIHSIKTVENLMEVDEDFMEKVKLVFLHVYGTLKYFPKLDY